MLFEASWPITDDTLRLSEITAEALDALPDLLTESALVLDGEPFGWRFEGERVTCTVPVRSVADGYPDPAPQPGTPAYAEQQRARVAILRRSGYTLTEIAVRLGASLAAVDRWAYPIRTKAAA